jgi:hypothetical protein
MNQDLRRKLDRITDILWAGGVTNPVTYIEQISYLIYLKLLDEEESVRELQTRLTGKSGNGNSQRLFPQQAERYRWSKWRFKSGEELRNFVRDEVFPYMGSLVKEEPQIAEYFRDAVLEIVDPNVLKQVIDELDSIDFRKLGTDVKGDIFEYLLTHLGQSALNGQFYLLQHLQLERLAIVTGVPGLNRNDGYRLRVPLPPLSEQRRIVEILDQADALRQLRAEADAKAERILPALFYKMFGDPATNAKGWPGVAMHELLALPPNYGTMIPPTSDPSGWLDLRVANIQGGRLDLSDRRYVELPTDAQERHGVRDGDLLLARAIGSRQHLGKCIVAHPGTERWAFDSHLMRVRFNRSRVHPEFVQAFLNSPAGRGEFLSRTRSSAVQFNINTGEFGAIRMPLPPVELQQRFVDHASRVSELETARQKAGAAIDRTFHTLLHRAFCGDLTAKWREAHMQELLAEMEQQAKALTGTSPDTAGRALL